MRAAIAAAEDGVEVVLLSKGRTAASGCSAQLERGIEYCALNCGPYGTRQQESLAADYLRTGMGLNRRDVVEAFVAGLPAEYERLMRLRLAVMEAPLAGPRLRWIGHRLHGGLIGQRGFARDLLRCLRRSAAELGVTIFDRLQAVTLDSGESGIRGVMALDLRQGGLRSFAAASVVLAAGGAGNLFPLTSNPADVVGDGLALARRCGAGLANTEFYSSYPLSLGRARRIYLIQPVLMAGRFMDARGETWRPEKVTSGDPLDLLLGVRDACRWIEARRRGGSATPGGGAWWDGSGIPEATYRSRIPITCQRLRRMGIDLKRDRLELAPHAHQSIGGVEVDAGARSAVPGLFAVGETAAGLHGALRINGSGVTAGLVQGAIAGRSAAAHARFAGRPAAPVNGHVPSGMAPASPGRLRALRDQIHSAMAPVLVVRGENDLRCAARELRGVADEVEAMQFDPNEPAVASLREEVRNMAEAAGVMVEHSLRRRQPLGLFLTS